VFEEDVNRISKAKKYFDSLLWKFLPDLLNAHMVSYILRSYPENSRLIELGCGTGTASRTLLEKRDYSIVLLDISEVALKRLSVHLTAERKEDRCVLVKDDFYQKDLHFPDQYFDVSYNVGVLEHFDDPVKALNGMMRISKRVICVVPAPSIYFKIGTLIRRIIERDASQWTEDTHYYAVNEWKKIFEDAAVKDLEIKTIRFMGHPLCNFITGVC
jgi:ubiquinone/menaquinone biosynthesis C-methylase UbiE